MSYRHSQVSVDVQNLDVQKGRALITDDFDVPSEVDEFWTRLRTTVVPAVKKKQAVSVEARLSEPPEKTLRHPEQKAWPSHGQSPRLPLQS